jgi:hypothetical protein
MRGRLSLVEVRIMSKSKSEKTILAVSSDVDVLVLMRGMLENDYRVLVAADAESALRLLTISGLQIDLAVVDSNVVDSRRGLLQRRMASILPILHIVPMASLILDGVIRLQILASSGKRTSGSLLERIRVALAVDESRRRIMTALSTPKQVSVKVMPIGARVMAAGRNLG